MRLVILGAVALRQQDLVFGRVPTATPVLVGPREAERNVRGSVLDHVVDDATEWTLTFEPVVVVTEGVDAMSSGRSSLGLSDLRHP